MAAIARGCHRTIVRLLFTIFNVLAAGEALAYDCAIAESLCWELSNVQPGEIKSVVVSGIYGVGPENRVLYAPGCRENVQPVTWVELASDIRGLEHLSAKAEAADQVAVQVKGILHGPPAIDIHGGDLTLGRLQVLRSQLRYGHLAAYRTKLVVSDVLRVEPVPPGCSDSNLNFWAPAAVQEYPPVLSSELPTYPEIARTLGIEGEVVLRLVIVRGAVTDAQVDGDLWILAREAIRSVKTWRFGENVSMTLGTVFSFRLEKRPLSANQNPRIEMQLPSRTAVIAVRNMW